MAKITHAKKPNTHKKKRKKYERLLLLEVVVLVVLDILSTSGAFTLKNLAGRYFLK
ncbi:MAG: hypothetical protein L3J15_08335 [Devosiaceae bacterium]|nr:hypothetical protein [Devosiaceae bacterium]